MVKPVYHFQKPLVIELYRGIPSWVTRDGMPQCISITLPCCDTMPQTVPCVTNCVMLAGTVEM